MNWNNAISYYWTVEYNSLTQAAEKLELTKNGILYRIKMLEEELNEKLTFSMDKISLTPYGKEVYIIIKKMLTTIDHFEDSISGKATLKIGLGNILTARNTYTILEKLENHFLDIRFYYGSELELYEMLENQTLDCVLYTKFNRLKHSFDYFLFESFTWNLIAPIHWNPNLPYSIIHMNFKYIPKIKKKFDETIRMLNLNPEFLLSFDEKFVFDKEKFLSSNNLILTNIIHFEEELKNQHVKIITQIGRGQKYLYLRKNLPISTLQKIKVLECIE